MRYALLLPLWLLISCVPGPVVTFDPLPKELRDNRITAAPTADRYPDADAVMVLDRTDVKMEVGNSNLYTIERVHRLLRIFKNVEENTSIDIPIDSGEELLAIAARTITADSVVIPLKKPDFLMMSGVGGKNIFYMDMKNVRFTFPSVKSGDFVEYAYIMKKNRPFVTDLWMVQHSIPTMKNMYTLTVPAFMMDFFGSWKYKPYNVSLDKPRFATDSMKWYFKQENQFFWEQRDVPAFEPEPLMPPASNFLQFVKFAPAEWKTWNDASRWYHTLFYQPRIVLTDSLRALAALLTRQCGNDEERIRALYRYVQKIRYVAIDLDQGGLIPNTPTETLRRQYGDCKDKSMLLHALLWCVNIEAHPVLVRTADAGRMDPLFPNWNFNHMIVKAVTKQRDVFWMDPTVEYAVANDLPWNCENIPVLVFDNDGSSTIETTPMSPHYNNVISSTAAVSVRSDLSLSAHITMKYEGEENVAYRYRLRELSANDLKEYCRSLFTGDFVTATVDSCTLINADSLHRPLGLSFTMTAPQGVKRQADLYFLNAAPFSANMESNFLSKEKRKFPLWFRYPSSFRSQTIITLPDSGFSLRDTLAPMSVSDQNFAFRHLVQVTSPINITVTEAFGIKNALIDTSRYSATKEFFQKMKDKQDENIILVRRR